MKSKRVLAIVTVALMAAGAAVAQPAPDKSEPVYTVATLLVGTRTGAAAVGPPPSSDGSMTMFIAGTSPLTVEQSAQMGEDLASLQQKLRETFQLDRIETAGSYAGWLSSGKEMILRSATGELTLTLTGGGRIPGTQPPFVAALPKTGTEPSDYERGYVAARMGIGVSAQYSVKLTAGPRVVFDRPMAVSLGQRSVFARHAGPNGALYFVVVSAPLSAADRARPSGVAVPEPDRNILAPRLVSGEDPILPAGTPPGDDAKVVLTATIGTDGRVSNIKVIRPAPGLTELAVAALRERRYEPARDRNGKPLEVQIAVVMPFRERAGATRTKTP
jgi:hypothetical protein